jgi:hypothetical protein
MEDDHFSRRLGVPRNEGDVQELNREYCSNFYAVQNKVNMYDNNAVLLFNCPSNKMFVKHLHRQLEDVVDRLLSLRLVFCHVFSNTIQKLVSHRQQIILLYVTKKITGFSLSHNFFCGYLELF